MATHSMSEIQKLNTMEVSDNGKEIINKFFHISRRGRILLENPFRLIVSLYATMPNHDQSLIELLDRYYVDLKEYLTEDEIFVLQKEASAVMRFCYKNKAGVGCDGYPLGQKMTGEMLIPEDLLSLFEKLSASIPLNADVYIPFAGHAQFALYFPYSNISGFELDRELWALSKIVLDTCGINANIQNAASSSEDVFSEKKYDCIVSFPPFLQGKEMRIVVDELYRLASKSLKEAGTMICFLPISFCNSHTHWVDLRKILIENNEMYSATVISLGPALNPHTEVNICAFVLHKDNMGSVELIDASAPSFHAIQDRAGSKYAVLKPISILESRLNGDELYVWKGRVDDLKDDINLFPGRYLMERRLPPVKNGEKRVALGDLIEICELERIHDPRLPIVGMKELYSNYINCEVQSNVNHAANSVKVRVLEKDSLLVGYINGKFKVGKVCGINSNNRMGLQQPVVAIKLIANQVSEDFLLRSLLSDEVKMQADYLASGTLTRKLLDKNLLEIQITVPPIEEQDRLCHEDARQSLSLADKKILDIFEEFRADIHVKKHAIGQTIYNLNNWWDALQVARNEGNGVLNDDALVSKKQNIKVVDVFANLQNTIERLQQQILKLDRANGLVKEKFSLSKFVSNYISTHQSPIFRFDFDALTYSENVENMDMVNFPKEALSIILDNIVSNACSHGFVEGKDEDYIIRFAIIAEGDNLILTVENNGKPVAPNVDQEYVFTYSKTTQDKNGHFGIGGYEVKKIMQEFGGVAAFVSKPEEEFPVMYRLTFYDTNMEETV